MMLTGEIRLKAERKAGQILSKLEKAKPGPKSGELNSTVENNSKAKGGQPHQKSTGRTTQPVEPTLRDLGISKQQSSDWQKMAAVPQADFDAALAEIKEAA